MYDTSCTHVSCVCCVVTAASIKVRSDQRREQKQATTWNNRENDRELDHCLDLAAEKYKQLKYIPSFDDNSVEIKYA